MSESAGQRALCDWRVERGRAMETSERCGTTAIRRALERLTKAKGVQVTEGDVVIKKTTGRSGRLLYMRRAPCRAYEVTVCRGSPARRAPLKSSDRHQRPATPTST